MDIYDRVAHSIMADSLAHDGGTYDVTTGLSLTSGFAVSVRTVTLGDRLMSDDIADMLRGARPISAIGTWWDFENAVWELSESLVLDTEHDAQLIGLYLGERYIYHLDTGRTITTQT